MKLDIEKFNPKVAELETIANKAKKLTVSDLHNTSEVAIVKEKRIELGKVRRSIEETGKALRSDAIVFQKEVLKRERELILIISPEEDRLKQIETDSKKLLIREDREKLLPERCEKFRVAGLEVGDNDLLEMDDNDFVVFYNEKLSEKLEDDRIKAEEEKAEEEEKKNKKERLAQDKIDKAQDKIDEEKRKIEQDKRDIEHEKELIKVKEQAIEDEKIAKIEEKKRAEKEAKEKKKQEDKNKLYQDFLKKNKYNETTDRIKETEDEYILYRVVARFKK